MKAVAPVLGQPGFDVAAQGLPPLSCRTVVTMEGYKAVFQQRADGSFDSPIYDPADGLADFGILEKVEVDRIIAGYLSREPSRRDLWREVVK